MPEAPLTCLDFWCRAGSVSETPAQRGMAHFLEHMVFKGSPDLPAGAFDRAIEQLGGSSNAATGYDDVHYHVLVPPEQVPRALELLLDLVLHPSLEAEDFSMERRVVLEEIAQSNDQPEERVIQSLLTLCCPDHPYGRPILGDPEVLLAMTPEAMGAFHADRYRAGNCCLAVAGSLPAGLAGTIAGSALADLPCGGAAPPTASIRSLPRRSTLPVPRLESGRLLMAWHQPAAADLDGVVGGDLITSLLGEGRGSVLVHRLREELRLAESVDLDLNVMEAGSLALLEVAAPAGQLDAVEAAVGEAWQEQMDRGCDSGALARAGRMVANGLRFALETPTSVAAMAGSGLLWGRRQALDHPLSLIDGWTPDRLRSTLLPALDPAAATVLRAVPA
ncbi:insulinase family protein [Synechococcus sp. RSCCF101]|nr:insulinase family protein [Synechococcus sp. RSCCF101]